MKYSHILVCALLIIFVTVSVVDADTLVIYTTGTQDGYTNRTGAESYANKITGAGVAVTTNSADARSLIQSRSSSTTFLTMNRPYFEFNTSAIPDNANVSAATISVRATSKYMGFTSAPSYSFTDFVPATNGTAVAADYNKNRTTEFTNEIAFASLSTANYNNFTVNADGISHIDVQGWFNTMFRDTWDQSSSFGGTYANSKNQSVYLAASEYTGTTSDPALTVTYDLVSAPVSNFTSNVTSGTDPTAVAFTDTSTNTPTSWSWSFNNVTDNNTFVEFSTSQNPDYTFTNGNWSIRLNTSNIGGSNTSTKKLFINVSAGVATPVASFTANVTSGDAPLAVGFTDTSTNTPTSWSWSFQNTTGNNTRVQFSTSENPAYTFGVGTWSIMLNATNAGGTDSSDTTTITVSAPGVSLNAAFSADDTTPATSQTVTFTDSSTGSPTEWAWYFGDENFTEPWTNITGTPGWTGRIGHMAVVLPDDSIVLMGGNDGADQNDTWRSTDNGVTWTEQNGSSGWLQRSYGFSVALSDGSIVTGGGTRGTIMNDVWRSTDKGVTWTQQVQHDEWSDRYGMTAVALPDDSIVVMGGYYSSTAAYNDTWRSTDKGASWTQMNASSGWGQRRNFGSVALSDGSIVLMGGRNNASVYYNDVWRSTDNGATWTLVTGSAGWTARYAPSVVVMPDDSIIVAGGNSGARLADVWLSKDKGATWTQLDTTAEWTTRYYMQIVAMHDGSAVLIGGQVSGSINKNDSWRMQPVGSNSQSPTHAYSVDGTYNVVLLASNSNEYDTEFKTGYITVGAGATTPVSTFKANPFVGVPPHEVTFNDTSANTPTEWSWSFQNVTGNNTPVVFSTAQNPVYTFGVGKWLIKLNATNAGGTNTSTQTTYIIVTNENIYSFVHTSDTGDFAGGYPNSINQSYTNIESLKSTYNITAIFVTGDISSIFDGGDGNPHSMISYTAATGYTTIPVYEVSGNHDVFAIANYTTWDTYVTSGSQKHNYGFVYNDFIVYGWGFNGGGSINASAKTEMQSMVANNATKMPIILTHQYFGYTAWSSGVRYQVGNETLDSLTRNSIILSGHCSGAMEGLMRQYDYNGSSFIEDMFNFQDMGNYDEGRLYTVTANATHITSITVSDLLLYPTLSVENQTYFNFNYYNPGSASPAASFTANTTSGVAPLAVKFNDTSSNTPTSWSWSFQNITPGNNTRIQFSTAQNVTYTFGVGNWSIMLNATNAKGTGSSDVTYLNVTSGVTIPVASFTSNVTSGVAPTAVKFNDTSSNVPTSWSWSFQNVTGNNTRVQFSTTNNVTYTFGNGNWSIMLNATNAAGTDSSSITFVNISVPAPTASDILERP